MPLGVAALTAKQLVRLLLGSFALAFVCFVLELELGDLGCALQFAGFSYLLPLNARAVAFGLLCQPRLLCALLPICLALRLSANALLADLGLFEVTLSPSPIAHRVHVAL